MTAVLHRMADGVQGAKWVRPQTSLGRVGTCGRRDEGDGEFTWECPPNLPNGGLKDSTVALGKLSIASAGFGADSSESHCIFHFLDGTGSQAEARNFKFRRQFWSEFIPTTYPTDFWVSCSVPIYAQHS